MPITTSAKKALRVSRRRRVFNLRRARVMKETVKNFKKLITVGQTAEATKLLPSTYQAIDKAKKIGIIKANAAARYKSQLAKALTKKS